MVSRASVEARLSELARRAGLEGVSPRVVAAATVVAVLAVAWALWRWWPASAAEGTPQPAEGAVITQSGSPADGASPTPASEQSTQATQSAAPLFVHVAGEVRRPGVYQVAKGARVIDAIEKAGGMLGDAAGDALNLARQVADGEQILVPATDDVAAATAPAAGPGSITGAGATAPAASVVNINTADATVLDTLPGVGPSTAAKIIAEREANGPFASPEDLGRVSGIGPKRLEQLKDLISVR